jgi:hypothetical protein
MIRFWYNSGFYIGTVIKGRDANYEVSFFRSSSKKTNAFIKPQVEDLTAVKQPNKNGSSTSRVLWTNKEAERIHIIWN